MTPFDVDIIEIPNPSSTRGRSFFPLYTRKPGLLTRSMAEITGLPW